MANGEVTPKESNERFAALDERVTNLRSSFQSLEHSTSTGFNRIDAKLSEMSASFAAGQQTPWAKIWPGITTGVVVIGMIVGMLYWPIRADQGRLESSLIKITEQLSAAVKEGPEVYVPRREIETARARATEDRINTLSAITDLRTLSLPRNEWQLRNTTVDGEFVDIRRSLDQLRQDFGGIYPLRDAFADVKDRLQRVETREKP